MPSRFWLVAAAVVVLDQWTKYLVQKSMALGEGPIPLIPGLVSLTHVHNTGVAFGQFRGAGPILVVVAAIAVAFIVSYRVRLLRSGERLHPLLALGLSLPLGGAVGNMIDRVRIGRVVDFIDLHWFPVFNVADSAITVGACALLFYFIFIDQSHLASQPEARSPTAERGNEQGA